MPNLPTSRESPLAQAVTPAFAAFAALTLVGSSESALLHHRKERLRQLADGGEVDGEGFVPYLVGGIDRNRSRAAGVVHEDVDVAVGAEDLVFDALGRRPIGEIGDD